MSRQITTFLEPNNLKPGDEIRIIAPSGSLGVVSEENRRIASKKLEELGFRLCFGKSVLECDRFYSSSIGGRARLKAKRHEEVQLEIWV